MNNVIKAASIVTSGVIFGSMLKKYVHQKISKSELSQINPIKSVKNIFTKRTLAEDVNNYFV